MIHGKARNLESLPGFVRAHATDDACLLAMKCLSARIGEESHDIDDIRFLLRAR